MNVLAFAATNSRSSINRALLDYAAGRLPAGASVNFLDLNAFEAAIYSPEREQGSGVPEEAQAFRDHIAAADALLISFAEHNGFVTAAWKNLFDWMSRLDGPVWQDKPMVLLAATPGPRAGAGVLGSQLQLAPFFGGKVVGSYGVGKWHDVWSAEERRILRDEDVAGVDAALAGLTALPAGP